MPECSFAFCGATRNLHKFPQDPDLRAQWTKFCFRQANWLPGPGARICREHFTPNSYSTQLNSLVSRLKKNAATELWAAAASKNSCSCYWSPAAPATSRMCYWCFSWPWLCLQGATGKKNFSGTMLMFYLPNFIRNLEKIDNPKPPIKTIFQSHIISVFLVLNKYCFGWGNS